MTCWHRVTQRNKRLRMAGEAAKQGDIATRGQTLRVCDLDTCNLGLGG